MPDYIPPTPNTDDLPFIWKDWFRVLRVKINALVNGYIDGDLIITDAAKGIVLIDTQVPPHYWRITVDNTGTLVTTDLGTTYP